MLELYEKIIATDNIAQAIKFMRNQSSSNIPGPDNIIFTDKLTDTRILQEVKLRLRGYKRVKCNKKNYNLFDRISQRAIFQQLEPICVQSHLHNNCGFRRGFGFKELLSHAIQDIVSNKKTFILKANLKEYFTQISLDKVLEELKNLIDYHTYKAVKHLSWPIIVNKSIKSGSSGQTNSSNKFNEEYNGIGLSRKNILATVLFDYYFQRLDQYMNSAIINLNKLQRINKYYRFGDELLIICQTKNDLERLQKMLENCLTNQLQLSLQHIEYQTFTNKFRIAKFYIKKDKSFVKITIDNLDDLKKIVKKHKFSAYRDTNIFCKWIIQILTYYDIANDIDDFLQYVNNRLFCRSRRTNSLIKKIKNHSKYEFKFKDKKYYIDIRQWRQYIKLSYKDYIRRPTWLIQAAQANRITLPYQWYDIRMYFTYMLYIHQRGKDIITSKYLNTNDMPNIHIHHLQSYSEGGNDEVTNLILISAATHRLIHAGKIHIDKSKINLSKKMLFKKTNVLKKK